jgi:hypothetical protein
MRVGSSMIPGPEVDVTLVRLRHGRCEQKALRHAHVRRQCGEARGAQAQVANYHAAVDHLQQAAILTQVSRPWGQEQRLAAAAGAHQVAARRIEVGHHVAGQLAIGRLQRGGLQYERPQASRIEGDELAQRSRNPPATAAQPGRRAGARAGGGQGAESAR